MMRYGLQSVGQDEDIDFAIRYVGWAPSARSNR